MTQRTGTPPDQTTPTLADEAHDLLLWAPKLTRDELAWLMGLAGRTHGPTFLADALAEGKITADTVASLIGDVWSSAEFPDRHHDRDTWRWMFDTAGFTVDGKQAPRPAEPMRLYRGSTPDRRDDWSWTRDIRVAEKFAAGSPGRPKGQVWVCTVPPSHMLAANSYRDEDEVVVDTRGLEIREVVR
ncbi:hypothetical protein OG342_08860 [Streptomyces bobili]|uniref:hypothetical protein n=1 Tax=Streptomyces bobili TaxID=67280 RepID=UPI00224CBD74|nr:hypothetical protein [Streptomyces bobili]MCX5522970.1 hypothetical protein [Streptomyces bobili]